MSEHKTQIAPALKRVPVNGTFELTIRCNLHCKMCMFRHDDSENAEIIAGELTKDQWIGMAEQAASAGTFNLLITGGEPMIRPDFCEIWEGIYKKGFIITLYTNATMVSEKVIETLMRFPPHKVSVTIYGAGPDTYEKVCGYSQAFWQMVKGVRLLQKLPSEIEFRTTIIKDNFQDIDEIDQMVRERFHHTGIVTHAVTVNKAVRGACAHVEDCRLLADEESKYHLEHIVKKICDENGEEFDPRRLYVVDNEGGVLSNEKGPMFGCPAAIDSYVISWDGYLLPCQMLDVFKADVVNEGLDIAWRHFPQIIELPPDNPKCSECDVADYCSSCYATRYAETGSLNGCSEYMWERASSKKRITESFRREKL